MEGGGREEGLCTYAKGKIVHEQWRFLTFKDWLYNIVNFKTETNRSQDATLGNTHLLLIRIKQSGLSANLEQSVGQTPINEGRQVASKSMAVQIREYTVFPRGVVSSVQIEENTRTCIFCCCFCSFFFCFFVFLLLFLAKAFATVTIKTTQMICRATFFSWHRTAPRPRNLWFPRPTSIGCSPYSSSFCTNN